MFAWAIVLWSLVAVMLGIAVYGLYEARQLREDRIRVSLPNLPQALRGLRIVHISDLHARPSWFLAPLFDRLVEGVNRAQADLILVSGDLAAGADNMPVAAGLLSRMTSRHGLFVTLGNHDVNVTMERWLQGLEEGFDVEVLRRILEGEGVRLLHNEAVTVEIAGCRVAIIGVGDASCGLDDLRGAIANLPPADLVILVGHSPDILDQPEIEVADLVLCGHTHGGQMMIPGWGSVWAPVWRDRRRGAGLLAFGDVACHVSRGVGVTWPVRVACPPQLAILELCHGPLNGLPLPAARTSNAGSVCANGMPSKGRQV
ncbi:MAG: metallophosphoesterase [Armatimonadetes bacterium]|nr:metallophosphoesterase [Armatimonadota bacterium]